MLTSFPIIDKILAAEPEASRPYLQEVLGGDSFAAEYVSGVLTDAGHPVSASTIRTYRRSLKRRAQV